MIKISTELENKFKEIHKNLRWIETPLHSDVVLWLFDIERHLDIYVKYIDDPCDYSECGNAIPVFDVEKIEYLYTRLHMAMISTCLKQDFSAYKSICELGCMLGIASADASDVREYEDDHISREADTFHRGRFWNYTKEDEFTYVPSTEEFKPLDYAYRQSEVIQLVAGRNINYKALERNK